RSADLDARRALTDALRTASTSDAIHDAVTVVIEVVAGLHLGRPPAALTPDAAIAHLHPRGADADRRSARSDQSIVRRTVAVVVETVADLGLGDAAAVGRRLVDLAIAVVVESIADLERQGAASAARIPDFVRRAELAVVIHVVAGIAGVVAQR